jgi:hypothetical protein
MYEYKYIYKYTYVFIHIHVCRCKPSTPRLGSPCDRAWLSARPNPWQAQPTNKIGHHLHHMYERQNTNTLGTPSPPFAMLNPNVSPSDPVSWLLATFTCASGWYHSVWYGSLPVSPLLDTSISCERIAACSRALGARVSAQPA